MKAVFKSLAILKLARRPHSHQYQTCIHCQLHHHLHHRCVEVVITTVVFWHILATFALVRTATEVRAVQSSLAALTAFGGALILDTFALNKVNDGFGC